MRIHKGMTNSEISELLHIVSAAYEIKDKEKNKYKVIAYDRASVAVEHLSSEAKDLWDEGKLEEVAGIGTSIAKHLDEIFRTGKSSHFEKVLKGLPPGMFELMKVSGIGAKTAYKLSKELNIVSEKDALGKLEKAVKEGRVENIEGFGEQSQESIEKAISEVKSRKKRYLLPFATELAGDIIRWLKKDENIVNVDPLGSLRRKASTVGDIDIACASKDPIKTLEHFVKYKNTKRVLEKGDNTASIILANGAHIDLMVHEPSVYGSVLQHFTGSKHHNIALREYANKLGLSLSEYGIKSLKTNRKHKFSKEKDFYEYLKLSWIPPELREDMGEIEKAKENMIPKLVELSDIKADLQIHSAFNIETSHDLGLSNMKDIVKKANELGYEYIALTEHNPSRSGHDEKQVIELLKKKAKAIEQINYSLKNNDKKRVMKVYNSLEVDILPDGNLAISDKALDLLDFALVSIHSSFKQDKKTTTNRVISALNHKKVKIFAHPTGRKINYREGVELDWDVIFKFCKENSKWIEINAAPQRLDLPDYLVKDAINEGIKLTLGTDAHHIDHMDNMLWGVSVAQRGWATKADIINSYSLSEFEKELDR